MTQRLSMTLHYHSNSATHGRGGGEEGVVKVACESSKRQKKKSKRGKMYKREKTNEKATHRRPIRVYLAQPHQNHYPIKTPFVGEVFTAIHANQTHL